MNFYLCFFKYYYWQIFRFWSWSLHITLIKRKTNPQMKNIREQYVPHDGKHNLLQLERVLQPPHSHWMLLLEYEYAQSHCPARKRKATFFQYICIWKNSKNTDHYIIKIALREYHIKFLPNSPNKTTEISSWVFTMNRSTNNFQLRNELDII